MGLSIEEQRKRRREERDPKRFHNTAHLRVDVDKIKGKPKDKSKKLKRVEKELEKLRGVNVHPNKGGKKGKSKKGFSKRRAKYEEYLRSDEWAQLRIDLFKHRGYVCERCNNKKKLQVHHKNYSNLFNEEPEDLEILCEKCHREEHK